MAVLLYQVPAFNSRLSWRLDIARTYLRGMLYPAGEGLPTPVVLQATYTPQASKQDITVTPTPTVISMLGDEDDVPVTASPPVSPTASPTTIMESPTPIPESASLPAPAWIKQDWNNCGPAALAMYLNYYGWEGDQYTISSQIKPVREDRNVNIEEMAHFARNNAGWLQVQYRVGGTPDLLREFIAAGIPVLIESTFTFTGGYWPNDDLWAAHYLLVNEYDADGNFTVQDTFYGPDDVVSESKLDEEWKPFNRLYMLIYLPEQEATVQSILGDDWDEETNRQSALDVAEAEIDADSEDAFAWFNLGTNLLYFEEYEQAAEAYDRAREIGLPQRMLRYQFGPFFAYFNSGRTEELLSLTEYALERTPNSEEALLWHGWALFQQGDASGAIADFYTALEANPNYQDAQYALDYVLGD